MHSHYLSQNHNNYKNKNRDMSIKSFRKEHINSLKSRFNYELMYEAFYIANLFYDMNETSKHKNDKSFYILSNIWFEKWKKYVNFDKYMIFHSKYLSINSLPIRPLNTPFKETFDKLKKNPKIKDKINKYFNSLFLTDNSENYPGSITNKFLLYDKKASYYNFENRESNYNYNIDEKYIYGKDYLVVTRDIWKFFQYIYGGKEIRRYNLNRELFTQQPINLSSYENNLQHSNPQILEILVEAKLKTLNIIIIRSNFKTESKNQKFIPFIVDSPRYLYVSHTFTIRRVKEKIKEIVSNFKGKNVEDLRLWILKDKTYQHFLDDLNKDFKNNIYSELKFPGVSLDIFGQNTKLEDLGDTILNNVIIVVESKIHMGLKGDERYIFKKETLDDRSENFKDFVIKIRDGKNLNDENIIEYKKSLYESIKFKNIANGYSNDNFVIKNYFSQKYQLDRISRMIDDDVNNFIEKISDYKNEKNSKLKDLFVDEVYNLKENMDLIIDESELINNVEGINLNMLNKNNKQSQSNLNNDTNMKKRKRKQNEDENNKTKHRKINDENYENIEANEKENGNLNENENENNIQKENEREINESNNQIEIKENNIETNEENQFCNYCGEELEQDFVICEKCGKAKYCNIICKNKDDRFHINTCNNDVNNFI